MNSSAPPGWRRTANTNRRHVEPEAEAKAALACASGSSRHIVTAKIPRITPGALSMPYQHSQVPAGDKISISNGKLQVSDRPIIPFIEGDGTGPDIWRASVRVMDAAVQKAYGVKRKISWMEVYAGEKAFKKLNSWLPDETVAAFREFHVGIK